MRVYLPTTLAALGSALVAGQIGPAPVAGFAVTPALREWYSSGDLEELEYVAMMQAARASLRLLHEDTKAPRRRVVLAAEIPEHLVTARNGIDKPGHVAVTLPVQLADVVSGHVDDVCAIPDIDAAAAAIPAADAGDGDAKFVMESAEGHELLWYATQELIYLIELTASAGRQRPVARSRQSRCVRATMKVDEIPLLSRPRPYTVVRL